ncbi:hypothetical protein [Advenella alkanexedens]|uniref:hypothetical protein n=1 Tax=Advenella alkanexedens TaxID=1481665 RepID=UPI0016BC4E80|nr:hypothetical protein [Advenella alkanexedens]NLY34060.1 hypothetical protein [Alcaligenaceae bacterium]WKU18595.1 hypothetical protein Q3V95_09790 [Advenella alkanexedens]
MRKYIIPALLMLTVSTMVQAQEKDTRSAWAKSQDMYVEPTLRIKETTIIITPEQAQQLNMGTKQLPAGSYQEGSTVRTIVHPDGRVEQVQEAAGSTVPVAPPVSGTTQMAPQGTAPVQDLSTPK